MGHIEESNLTDVICCRGRLSVLVFGSLLIVDPLLVRVGRGRTVFQGVRGTTTVALDVLSG